MGRRHRSELKCASCPNHAGPSSRLHPRLGALPSVERNMIGQYTVVMAKVPSVNLARKSARRSEHVGAHCGLTAPLGANIRAVVAHELGQPRPGAVYPALDRVEPGAADRPRLLI